MIQILKDHTKLLADMQSEVINVSKAVRKLIGTADENKKVIQDLQNRVEENKVAMSHIDEKLVGFRVDIDDIKTRIEILPEMRENIHVSYSTCCHS